MKRVTFLLISFFALLELTAQSLSIPKEVVYYYPEDTVKGIHYTEVETFQPIGWSQDGKFAYASFYNDYSNGPCVDVIVQDMISDTIIWSWDIKGWNILRSEGNDSTYTMTQEELWGHIQAKSEKALTKCGIKFNQQVKLLNMNFRDEDERLNESYEDEEIIEFVQQVVNINQKDYNFVLTEKENLLEDSNYKLIQIDCMVKGVGKKTIYTTKSNIYTESYYGIEGIIKSPYENRILVLCSINKKGFEFIRNKYYVLIGCHLSKGFK